MTSRLMLAAAVGCLVGATGAGAVSPPPLLASPAGGQGVAVIEARCPTFSWSLVPAALAYELSVFAWSAEEAPTELGEPVVRHRLAGVIGSWTPALGSCLEPGRQYVWVVRAELAGETTDWSQPGVFRVAPPAVAPAADARQEVERPERLVAGADRSARAAPGAAPPAVVGSLPSAPSTRPPATDFEAAGLSASLPAMPSSATLQTAVQGVVLGPLDGEHTFAVHGLNGAPDGIGVVGDATWNGGTGVEGYGAGSRHWGGSFTGSEGAGGGFFYGTPAIYSSGDSEFHGGLEVTGWYQVTATGDREATAECEGTDRIVAGFTLHLTDQGRASPGAFAACAPQVKSCSVSGPDTAGNDEVRVWILCTPTS